MKLGLLVYGSNGDVELFTSLALGLVERNHEVNLFIITINNRDYSFLEQTKGIKVYQKFFDAEIRRDADADVEFWNQPIESQFDLMANWYNANVKDIVEYSYRFCEETDVVIGPQHLLELSCIAEKMKKPYISLRAFPGYVRSKYEAPFWLSFIKDEENDRLWDIFENYENKSYKRYINKFRREHGLPPITNVLREVINSPFLNLITYSTHLYKMNLDWPSGFELCGFFKAPTNYNDWELSSELQEFIDGDEKPIFMTVGTMLEYENNISNIHSILLDVAKRVGRKVIIHSKWEEGNIQEGNIYKLTGFISYPKLLGHCALAIHHGGVGTSHIVTEASCPSIIIEYGCEQPFNANILKNVGVSCGSIARRDLNSDDLLKLVEESLNNVELSQNAQQVGELLKHEKGVENAITIIERTMSKLTIKKM